MGILETLIWIALQLASLSTGGIQSNESTQSNEGVIWEQPPPGQP